MKDAQAEAERILSRIAESAPLRRARRAGRQRSAMHRHPPPSTAGCCCCRRWCSWRCSPTGRRSRRFIDSFYSTPRAAPSGASSSASTISPDARRPGVLAGAVEQSVVRARHDSGRRSALALLMACGSTTASPAARWCAWPIFTPTVLPMIAVANIWLFFYTPQYGLLEQVVGAVRRAIAQLARLQGHGARLRDHRRDLEGGRLLHDLLSRRAAADPADPRRGGGAGGRIALVFLPARAVPAADADHAVRAHQRGDQCVPHGRPHHRHDARRARQRHHAAAVLHLSGRLQFLGHGLCGGADVVLLRAARR